MHAVRAQGQDGEVNMKAEMDAIRDALDTRMKGKGHVEGYGDVPDFFVGHYLGLGASSMSTQNNATLFPTTPGNAAQAGADKAKEAEEKRKQESEDAAREAAKEVVPCARPHNSHHHATFFMRHTRPRLTAAATLLLRYTEGGGKEADGGETAGAERQTSQKDGRAANVCPQHRPTVPVL